MIGNAGDTDGLSEKIWAEGQKTQTYTSKQARKGGTGEERYRMAERRG